MGMPVKRVILCLFVLVWSCLPPMSAAAHVLVRDQTGRAGLIMHVTPGDDPVAGVPSTIFFDVEGVSVADRDTIDVSVTHNGRSDIVAVQPNGNGLRATYTFARQGVYAVRLTIDANDRRVVFVANQRVSRGVGQSSAAQTYAWAEIGLMAAVVGLAALSIIAWNRRHEITRASQF
jgi:hypothetical protein